MFGSTIKMQLNVKILGEKTEDNYLGKKPEWEKHPITLTCVRKPNIKDTHVVCRTPETLYGVLPQLLLIHSGKKLGLEKRPITLTCVRKPNIKNTHLVCCTTETLYGVLPHLLLIHSFFSILITLTITLVKCCVSLYSPYLLFFFPLVTFGNHSLQEALQVFLLFII